MIAARRKGEAKRWVSCFAEKINGGKAKLLFLAFNLVLCFKNRINFEIGPSQDEL